MICVEKILLMFLLGMCTLFGAHAQVLQKKDLNQQLNTKVVYFGIPGINSSQQTLVKNALNQNTCVTDSKFCEAQFVFRISFNPNTCTTNDLKNLIANSVPLPVYEKVVQNHWEINNYCKFE
ncbi:hypothetical protein FLAV_00939 [Flavobacteriales bacterium]|nr:hypothetical protein [Flavobacteriales bacterium]GIK68886.1 MAG: hypothetical protein BroJett020_01810 [Bacteroidota bacterium]CAG0965515.1 hypothetical protein FLAV_00939 [Flavobacteriales bacterium]